MSTRYLAKQMLFPLSVPYRIYSPGWVYNILVGIVFLCGIGVFSVVLIPQVTRETLPIEAYLLSGGSLFVIGVFMTLIFLTLGRVSAWQERRAIRNIKQGKEVLATWQYAADEWHTLAEMQSASEQSASRRWRHNWIVLIMMGGIIGYMLFTTPSEVRGASLLTGAFMASMIVLFEAGSRIGRRVVREQNRQRRVENPTPTLYISRTGLYHETEGILRFGQLQKMTLQWEDGLPKLVFYAWFSSYSRFATGQFASVSIPIPRQHLPDAQKLVEQVKHRL